MPIILSRSKEKNETNSRYAYHMLHENIMTLHLEPGAPINEPILADALCVSRTPVREALFRLKQENLVDILPQKESSVSKIDFPLVHEALFLRSTIEPFAIVEASRMLTSRLVAELEKNLEEQQAILHEQQELHRFFWLDNEFHRQIYQAAGLEHLWKNISLLSTHYDRVRYIDIIIGNLNLAPLYLSHKDIFAFITDHKTQHIDSYVLAHLSNFLTTEAFLRPKFHSFFSGLPTNKN